MDYKELITEKNFGKYTFTTVGELTKQERSSTRYAAFYDFPVAIPTEEKIMALLPGSEIDWKDSMTPADYAQMFRPGNLACENGFCVRPEGYGFSAIDTKLPNVTMEMFQWFCKWFGENPVHYKAWLPGFHVDSTPGMLTCEDLGWGVINIDTMAGAPWTPALFGIEDPQKEDPDFIGMIGGLTNIYSLDGSDSDHPMKLIMLNYFRRCGNGIENRIRAWMGIHYVNGEIVYDKVESPFSLYDRTRLLACHNAWEWSRLTTFLPELYQYAKKTGDA